METSENLNINEFVTDQIIKELKAGRIPWKRIWTQAGIPFNPVSKQPYTGVNLLLLSSLGYSTNYFLTFNEIKELGGKIKGGEKGHTLVYWKKSETEEKRATIHVFTVFNSQQCEDLPETDPMDGMPEKPLETCHAIIQSISNMPKVTFSGKAPEYFNDSDLIELPLYKSFDSKGAYYYTLFQQLIISTGGEKRFKRKEVMESHPFGSRKYALRELTAELGSWILASIAGLPIPQTQYEQEYIAKWIEKLESDWFLAISAANYAQQSVQYLLNQTKDEVVLETVEESSESNELVGKTEKQSNRKKSIVSTSNSSNE